MKLGRLITSVGVALTLAGCTEQSVQNPYCPLRDGARWEYARTSGASTPGQATPPHVELRVDGVTEIDGTRYFKLVYFGPGAGKAFTVGYARSAADGCFSRSKKKAPESVDLPFPPQGRAMGEG